MDTLSLALSFIEEHRYLGYLVLFLGMIVEGEVILMIGGILANLDALNLKSVFIVSFFGVLANDVIWYYMGAYLKRNHGHQNLLQHAERKVKDLLPSVENNPAYAIFISKFIAGFNHPTLIILGFLKIDFRYFIKLQIFASLVWTLVFISLGFIFGHTAISFSRKIHEFIIFTILLIVSALLLERVIHHIVKKNDEKSK